MLGEGSGLTFTVTNHERRLHVKYHKIPRCKETFPHPDEQGSVQELTEQGFVYQAFEGGQIGKSTKLSGERSRRGPI